MGAYEEKGTQAIQDACYMMSRLWDPNTNGKSITWYRRNDILLNATSLSKKQGCSSQSNIYFSLLKNAISNY